MDASASPARAVSCRGTGRITRCHHWWGLGYAGGLAVALSAAGVAATVGGLGLVRDAGYLLVVTVVIITLVIITVVIIAVYGVLLVLVAAVDDVVARPTRRLAVSKTE